MTSCIGVPKRGAGRVGQAASLMVTRDPGVARIGDQISYLQHIFNDLDQG